MAGEGQGLHLMKTLRHPPELIERVRELAAQIPPLSASWIGGELSLSRNAIIGICHRHHIALLNRDYHSSKPKPLRVRRPRPRRPNYNIKAPAFAMPIVPDPLPLDKTAAVNPVTLADLDMANHCRWPIGHPRDPSFRYCGGPRECPGEEAFHFYCAGHARVAFSG
jgi:GcrA cell cycle regulator